MIKKIRQNKKLLFASIGFLSGAIGALFGHIFVLIHGSPFLLIICMAFWVAISTSIISLGLLCANMIYSRKNVEWAEIIKTTIPVVFVAGILAGGIAQIFYGIVQSYYPDNPLLQLAFRAIAWGIYGVIIGWRVSTLIPNMDQQKGIIAGLAGGLIGGTIFHLTFTYLILPELLGRMIGVSILGAALGLCLIIVEERYRSAFLEVHWGPHEANEYTLGEIPIYIGGEGKNEIHVSKMPHHAVSISMENGIIKVINTISGETKEMKEGSKIVMGNIEFIVRAN